MAIVTDLDLFVPQSHQALDIKLVLAQALDPGRGEHDDFSSLRWSKIVTHSIDEEMVSRADPQLDNILSGVKELPAVQSRPQLQRLLPVIRREPDGIGLSADHHG